MAKSLREFIEKYSAVQELEVNLKANLDAMTDLDEKEKETLLRLNMIMVRQCLQDFGAE